MTPTDILFGLTLAIGAALATALAILALPVVRAARSRPRRLP